MTFIDIDEDGLLDYVIQKKNKDGLPYLMVLYNNVETDNFFMKAMFLNAKQTMRDIKYGYSGMGVSYRFVMTGLDDKKLMVVGS